MSPTAVLAKSEELHQRVRAFSEAALDGTRASDDFDALALALARFQAEHVPGFSRLVALHGSDLSSVASIPAVPADAFRVARVAVHPPAQDAARFRTSGTTSGARGVHPMRTLETYRRLAVAWGRKALAPEWRVPFRVVALAPPPGPDGPSSLEFMMRAFMEAWDGRSLGGTGGADRFDAAAPSRWLFRESGADLDGLRRAAALASKEGEPLLILATSFALAFVLDALGERTIDAPSATVVMVTGGFKGRRAEVAPEALVAAVAAAFRIDPSQVVGEYGMTELSSQLYEGVLAHRAPRGVYLEPPWLRVTPVHPETLHTVPEGEPGLARFVDLANVDSAVAVLTQDRVRRAAGGIELLGRAPDAPLRGCSLAVEELVIRGAPS